jgi:hypothetical protein
LGGGIATHRRERSQIYQDESKGKKPLQQKLGYLSKTFLTATARAFQPVIPKANTTEPKKRCKTQKQKGIGQVAPEQYGNSHGNYEQHPSHGGRASLVKG